MANEWIEIDQLAAKANKGVSTVRKYLKDLPKEKKDLYIKKIQLNGKGGIKHLYHSNLITLLFFIERDDRENERDDRETIEREQKDDTSGQQSEPEDDKIKNGSSESIIEILRGQIEYLQRQSETKDGQISELLERLKESQYNLASMQKQLTAPQDDDKKDAPKWWQFWK